MLSFFRVNDPYRLLVAFLISAALTSPFVFNPAPLLTAELKGMLLGEAFCWGKTPYVHLYDDTPPLAMALFGAASCLLGRSLLAWRIAAWLLLFLQATYFSIIINRHRLLRESNYMPTLLACTLALFSFDFITVSAELFGSLALLMAFHRLVKISSRNRGRDDIFMGLGFYLGIASLIVFSYSFLFLAALISVLLWMSPSLRNIATLFIGFLLPHLALVVAYYFWNRHGLLWDYFYYSQFHKTYEALISLQALAIMTSSAIALFTIALFAINATPQFSKQGRQIANTLLLWSIASVVSLLWFSDRTPAACWPLLFPFAYFIAAGLSAVRQRLLAETLFLVAILSSVALGTLARYGWVAEVGYASMLPAQSPYEGQIRGKKIMVLCDDWGAYRQNTLGGGFLNWSISSPLFQDPPSYDALASIAWNLEHDAPEIILDPNDQMAAEMERMPYFRQRYVRQGALYIRQQRY